MLIFYFWHIQEATVWQVLLGRLFTEDFNLHFVEARGLNKQCSFKMFVWPQISTSFDFPLLLQSTVKLLWLQYQVVQAFLSSSPADFSCGAIFARCVFTRISNSEFPITQRIHLNFQSSQSKVVMSSEILLYAIQRHCLLCPWMECFLLMVILLEVLCSCSFSHC